MKIRLNSLLTKNIVAGTLSLMATDLLADNTIKPYWQDVQVVAVNKEYPRSSFMTYDNMNDALTGKFEQSRYYRPLNGTWKFYYVGTAHHRSKY